MMRWRFFCISLTLLKIIGAGYCKLPVLLVCSPMVSSPQLMPFLLIVHFWYGHEDVS